MNQSLGIAAQQAAKSAAQQKNADRAAAVSLVRALVGRPQTSADVDDTERATLNITVPDAEPTPIRTPTCTSWASTLARPMWPCSPAPMAANRSTTWAAGVTPRAKRTCGARRRL